MKPFIDETRLERVNAELKRALAEADPDVLAGRFSPRRPDPKVGRPKPAQTVAAAGSGRKVSA